MKFKSVCKLSFSKLKENKFKTIINLLIIVLFMTLIICFFTFKNSFFSFIDDWINSDYQFKLIQVDVMNKDVDDTMVLLKNINNKHISAIFRNNLELNLGVKVENHGVELFGNYDGFNYKIIKGTDIKSKNDIVCPNYMIGGDWTSEHNIDNYLNMKDKIGQKLSIDFEQKYVTKEFVSEIYQKYHYELNLVGVYDAFEELNGYNKCFVSKDVLNDYFEKAKTIYEEEREKKDNNQLPVLVLVDNYKNFKLVKNDIESLGLSTYIPEIELGNYETIFKAINIITIIIVIISLVCMFNFIKSNLNESKKDIALYKVLGFKTKDIKRIYYMYYNFIFIISIFLSIILSFIIKTIVSIIISSDPNFSVLVLRLSFTQVLLYLIMLSMISFIIIYFLMNKNFKKNIPLNLLKG